MNGNTNETKRYRRKMTDFAESFIRPYEEIYFYKDLRTWVERYLDLVIIGIITFIIMGMTIYLYGKSGDDLAILLVGGVITLTGIFWLVYRWIYKKIPELILTNRRVIKLDGPHVKRTLEEAPYDKINGMNFENTRKLSSVVLGVVVMFIGGGLGVMSSEYEGNTLYTVGSIGVILIFTGLLIVLFWGFSFSYVFKVSGYEAGNIDVPCIGRKNRQNANIINSIVMDMREFGEWKHRPMKGGRQSQQQLPQQHPSPHWQPPVSPIQPESPLPRTQQTFSQMPRSTVQSGPPQPPFPS